ncbi:MAG: hypothetical protein B7Z75_12335 [Acidocella sp. 20-57-95]|nr:MAG: hypothetical protein B7Z75_12335 [Acidocella sp. 20-57-95]OYV59047.1 MAG: hypothetical protein B7Z71_08880 [Acidocella sp. 21-58-7]HQT64008.1 Hint domain-containing protein [Acidocella sp.]HQU04749.1 Hint domain-containing protein [Acidocella sp.]
MTVQNGGIVNVEAKGTLNAGQGITVDAASTLTVYSQGTLTSQSDITVSGVFTVNTGSTVTDASGLVVNPGATVNIYGTFIPGSTGLSGSGTVTVNGGTFGSSAHPLDATGTNNIVITNGATVYMNNANPPGSISFGAGVGNTLILTNYVTSITTPITNFGAGDTIQFLGDKTTFTGVTATAGTVAGTYTVTMDAPYNPITLTDVTFTSSITSQITANGNGTFNVPGVTDAQIASAPGYYQLGGCFLAGTAIATPAGTVPVETLRAGDFVTVETDGQIAAKPVKWIGYRTIKPGDLTGDDAHPVRVKANAFGDAVPARDLLITNEHCIFIEGGLVPVRMLVNGSSIISDTSITSFTYYHVELEEHGILLAEGLAVESYLDTGNRGDFANAPVPSLFPSRLIAVTPTLRPAAPLFVDVATVKPVWDRLAARAAALGMKVLTPALPLSDEPELHLQTADGRALQPLKSVGNRVTFAIPADAGPFSLASRTSRPCDVVGAYMDDRRALGVSVGAMILHAGGQQIAITAHLDGAPLAGWHAPEGPTHRWTNGLAELPLSAAPGGLDMMLDITILQAGPYLAAPVLADALAA